MAFEKKKGVKHCKCISLQWLSLLVMKNIANSLFGAPNNELAIFFITSNESHCNEMHLQCFTPFFFSNAITYLYSFFSNAITYLYS